MRALPQWLLWRFQQFDGEPKPRKVPVYANGRQRRGTQGSDADRAALVSFDAAVAALERGRFDGVGFAFLPGDGLIGIDIDGAIDAETGEVSARCRSIIEACASYTELSPSGRGVHIIVAGSTRTFKNNAVGLEVFCGRQYFTCTGRRWAGTPDQVVPISEVTLRRLRATVKGSPAVVPAPTAPPAGAKVDDLQQRLESALLALNPDLSHDEWVQVGMGVKHALGEGGFRLWDYWSSRGSKYPGAETLQRKWASFRADGGITEATVFKAAMAAGWRPQRSRPKLSVVGGREAGARKRQAADASIPPPAEPPSRGGSGGSSGGPPSRDWRDDLLRSNGGKKDCRENVYMCLVNHPKLKGLVGYDEFAHRVMKLRKPPWDSEPGEWNAQDDFMLGYWLARHERLVLKAEGTIVAGVAMAAHEARFHPVRAYLKALPPWDEIERLPFWLHECLGAEGENSTYTRLVGTWFVMGLVQRVLNPGCQMDYMVVLEGLQGKGKSTALRTLVGNDAWYADTPLRIGTSDALLSLAGVWLYVIEELASFNNSEVEVIKSYVSSRDDRVREPYARRFSSRPRSGVFAGTTNRAQYFKDPTGARRFWPVTCFGEIDLAKLDEWRDKLFAEALWRLNHTDAEVRRYWPTRAEEEEFLVPEQERRSVEDPWFEKVAPWLQSKAKFGDTMHEIWEVPSFTTFELLTKCIGVPPDRVDGARNMAMRIGSIMQKLGWARQRDTSGARLWRYVRPEPATPVEPPASASVPVQQQGAA